MCIYIYIYVYIYIYIYIYYTHNSVYHSFRVRRGAASASRPQAPVVP